MDVARVAQLLLVATLLVAAVVKTWDSHASRLGPGGRALSGWLATGFWLLTVGNGLSLPVFVSALDAITGRGVSKVIFNAATVLGMAALLVFFYRSAGLGAGPQRRAVRITVVVASAVAFAQAVLMVLTPAAARGNSVLSPTAAPTVIAFYAVGGLWLVWGHLRCGLFALRFTRATTRVLAAACGLITAGFLLAGLTSAVRLIITLASATGPAGPALTSMNSVNFSLDSVGQGLGAVGLCVLGVLRLVDRRRRARIHRDLGPLHTRLREAFPEVRLTAPPHGAARHHAAAASYERCLVEVWDGMMRLSAPLNAVVAGREPTEIGAGELAGVIADATATSPPTGAREPTVASPALLAVLTADEPDRGLETGAGFLASISRELDHRAAAAQP